MQTNDLKATVARFLRRSVVGGALLAALFAMTGVFARAQTSGTGSIQGTVTDPTGAVVPGAIVVATNLETGVGTEAKTTGSGSFNLPLLKPGTYNVTITMSSFAPVTEKNIVVDALSAIAVNARLSTTVTTEAVTVTGEQGSLQTEDLRLGSNIESETYDSLPLAQNKSARDPSAFIGLAVGVNSFSTQPAGPSTASFNGGQTYQNETYIEGLPLTSAGTESDTRNLAFGVSVEAVEQFQVAVTGSEATYEGQGVSNFIVKSGSNKFHGNVFEIFRNTVLDAKPFFAANFQRLPEHQNSFGGTISGPVLKDRLFFFANYEGFRYSSATLPLPQNIPTLAERSGDFSAAGLQPIYDPNTCTQTNAAGTCIQRMQFPNNMIPTNRLSKAALSFQSYLPQPLPGSGISANYNSTLPDKVNNDSGTAKVDYAISANHRMSALFTRGKYVNPLTGSLAVGGLTSQSALPPPYTAARDVVEYSTLAQLHEAWTIRPNLVNDFGFGFNRLFIPLGSLTAAGNYPTKAGLTGLPAGIASTAFPDITFSDGTLVSWAGTNAHINTEAQSSFTAQDNLLYSRGRHQMTLGYQYQTLQDNFNNPQTGSLAGFTFAKDQTGNFNGGTGSNSTALNAATGNSYASFLLGGVASSSIQSDAVIETGGRYKTNAAYFQDNIKVNPGLTINFGLRYDVWFPFKEVLNRQSFFDPNAVNPVAGGHLGALSFSGYGNTYNCNCDTPVNIKYKNFGPRIGFAQKLGNKAVLRGAYGILYAHAGSVGGRVNGRQGLSQFGFNNVGAANSTVTGQPAYYWDAGVPGNTINPPFFNPSYGIGNILATAPGAAAIGSGPGTATSPSYTDRLRDGQPPQYQNFFLNVQYGFTPNTTMSVAYSGSLGRYLPGAGLADQYTNQIPLQYLPLQGILGQPFAAGQAAAAAAPYNITVPLPYANYSGTLGQALRPYPQYNAISNPWRDVGKSSYNSLQVTFNRRSPKDVTFMVNYTWSKEEDDLAGLRLPGALYLEYTVGSLYRRHVVQSTVGYYLPFGKGKYFNPSNSFVRAAVGDFKLNAIVTGSSGAPISVGGTCTGGGIIDASCYPNLAAGFTGSVTQAVNPTTQAQAKATQYITPTAFTNPGVYTYGNAARNAPYGLFAPHIANIDANIQKRFTIFEGVKFLFEADVFNLPNRVYFGAPNASLTSGCATAATNAPPACAFGTITSQANSPRKFQFLGRIEF